MKKQLLGLIVLITILTIPHAGAEGLNISSSVVGAQDERIWIDYQYGVIEETLIEELSCYPTKDAEYISSKIEEGKTYLFGTIKLSDKYKNELRGTFICEDSKIKSIAVKDISSNGFGEICVIEFMINSEIRGKVYPIKRKVIPASAFCL